MNSKLTELCIITAPHAHDSTLHPEFHDKLFTLNERSYCVRTQKFFSNPQTLVTEVAAQHNYNIKIKNTVL
jgi:hypothetical protein